MGMPNYGQGYTGEFGQGYFGRRRQQFNNAVQQVGNTAAVMPADRENFFEPQPMEFSSF